ncbi:hypothetical protein NQZ79_g6657 [Umbelopsis isabellina]|nr:hypothetical protein NQZ79_g6657 [Umbelopsis isabellina]
MPDSNQPTPPPQIGVHFEFDTAKEIVLSATASQLHDYTESGLGYNNRIYYCQVKEDRQYILKVQGRFWTKIKTETEVAGIQLAKKLTQTPVPEILQWESSPKRYGHEYLLMSKLPGVSLDQEWGKLEPQQKMDVLDQLAGYVAEMHENIRIGTNIGNFSFDINNGVVLGKTVEASIGPWDTFEEMMISQLQDKLNAFRCQDQYAFLLRGMQHELTDLMRSIESGEIYLPPAPARVFTHGDLNEHNIMVERVQVGGDTKLKIVGILDFEWSGMFPCTEEYFASYEFLNSDPYLKNGFYDKLERLGVSTPRTIPHFESHAKLIQLRESIAPWWITEDSSQAQQEQCVKELRAAIGAVQSMPRFQ